MTMKEILNLDCREAKSNLIIQRALLEIKPLSKFNEVEGVPFIKIEKVIIILSKKYNMRIKEILPDIWSNNDEIIWRSILVNDNLGTERIIYGLSLYEVLAKTAIYMYSIREKIGER